VQLVSTLDLLPHIEPKHMQIKNIMITTGNYSVELNGSIADSEIQKYVELGIKSKVYRKVFPKTELAMAIALGETVFKDGKHTVNKEFKRAKVAYESELATKLQEIVQKEMGNGFVAEVKQYVAATPGNTAQKAFDASMEAIKDLEDLVGPEVFAAKVAALKAKYGQE